MRVIAAATATLVLVVAFAAVPRAQQAPPAPVLTNTPGNPPWAYPVSPAAPVPPEDGKIFHVPNSTVGMSIAQAHNTADTPDWYPDDHPAMPEVVKHGRPNVRACGYCHYPNGLGRPENASLAGLTLTYFIQQVNDFKSGARKSSDSNMRPPNIMIDLAKAATDDDVREAAEYFTSMKLRPWIKVIESRTAPRTEVIGGMALPLTDHSTEPLGARIVEVPADRDRSDDLRDSQSPFLAYVPVGSVAKGEGLATTGGATIVAGKIVPGKTAACSTCHGPDLTGYADVPPIAGRSPSYLVRQLLDMQKGNRSGAGTKLMKPVVTNLTMDDIIAIVAYVSSQSPVPSAKTAQR